MSKLVVKGDGSFDFNFPLKEQLPRIIEANIIEQTSENKPSVKVYLGKLHIGNEITDNSYENDGYRFHDVFHITFASVLGWSPVIRKLLGRKRKSDPLIDEVEDGGRAKVLEEGICALVFTYGRENRFLENVDAIDPKLLKLIRSMVSGLEVRARSVKEWESAILQGFNVWRQLVAKGGGKVVGNFSTRTITFNRD